MMPRRDKRPVNLSLWHFRFPFNALVSISHRVSGVVLILSLAAWLLWFNLILLDSDNFSSYLQWLSSFSGKLFLTLFWSALSFHWLAGVRHLILEFSSHNALKQTLRSNTQAKWLAGLWLLSVFIIIWGVWL